MREIKFRIWDELEKYYRYSFDGFHEGVDVLSDVWEYIKGNGYIVEQFTGLKDKNRKDVYFGDKIKIHGDPQYTKFDGWIVSDDEPEYIMLKSPDGKDAIPLFSFDYTGSIEVIGTIHE